MNRDPQQTHGRELIEALKGHLVSALAAAPPDGWELGTWADRAGVIVADDSELALASALAGSLVKDGRVAALDDGRFGAASTRSPFQLEAEKTPALAAPEVWAPGTTKTLEKAEDSAAGEGPQIVSGGHGAT